MTRILLCSGDDGFAARLSEAIGPGFLRIAPTQLPRDAAELSALVGSAGLPELAIIDATAEAEAALELAADLRRLTPAIVVLVSPQAEELAFAALRAGACDAIHPWSTVEQLRLVLDRASRQLGGTPSKDSAQEAPPVQGRVITVTSPKGGVGKTTVATNLAVGLALKAPQQVVLVDADVHFGDVASALNLEPELTLAAFLRGLAAADSIALKGSLTSHVTGLFVIPGAESPAAADVVTAADLAGLLDQLRNLFAYVVVDTAPGLTDHTLTVLDHTDSLVLVTGLDVPGVRGLRKELDTLADLHIVPATRHIVVNFYDDSRGLTIADVEATIRSKVDIVIPVSTAVPLSTNQGITLMQSRGRDPASRRLRELVDLLAGDDVPDKRRRGRRSPR